MLGMDKEKKGSATEKLIRSGVCRTESDPATLAVSDFTEARICVRGRCGIMDRVVDRVCMIVCFES